MPTYSLQLRVRYSTGLTTTVNVPVDSATLDGVFQSLSLEPVTASGAIVYLSATGDIVTSGRL